VAVLDPKFAQESESRVQRVRPKTSRKVWLRFTAGVVWPAGWLLAGGRHASQGKSLRDR
jgi:hypothetical protein